MEPARSIDIHHHIVPKAYVDRLSKKGITKGLGVPLPPWNVQKSLEVMDLNGIETALVSISAPGVYFDKDTRFAKELSRQTNEICAELIAAHPQRFGAFATLPVPDIDAALEELQYALDVLHLDGVILLSNYDGYYLGDPRFDRLFAELNRRKAVVFLHPTTPPGLAASHLGLPEAMMDVCFDTTRTTFSLLVNGVLKNYPHVRFILAHAGGTVPYIAARVGITATMLADMKGAAAVIADGIGLVASAIPPLEEKMPGTLSYYLRFKKNVLPESPDFYLKQLYYDTALSASPHAFASLQTLVTSSHIVLGTDYVFATQAAVPLTMQGIRKYTGFSAEDQRAIEQDNARALFPRLSNHPG